MNRICLLCDLECRYQDFNDTYLCERCHVVYGAKVYRLFERLPEGGTTIAIFTSYNRDEWELQ